MLDRHKHAIKKNDRDNWLHENLNLLTEEEQERYWSALRTILLKEITIKELYELAKGREEKVEVQKKVDAYKDLEETRNICRKYADELRGLGET